VARGGPCGGQSFAFVAMLGAVRHPLSSFVAHARRGGSVELR